MRKRIDNTTIIITKAFNDFVKNQRSVGILLILCTAISLFLANSMFSDAYTHFWHYVLSFGFSNFKMEMSISHFINDALMAVFFLLIGLEIKRELNGGELSSVKKASLPIAAAIGGMLVPALIYVVFNAGTPTKTGWGIPMATDIAFAIGILSLLGSRVPISLKILLTALAVVDDLGAIVVIALFYTGSISVTYLLFSGIVLILLSILNYFKVRTLVPYLILGLFLWYFVFMSGIHATISGVLLAFTIPFNRKDMDNPLLRLEHALHTPVNFLIMPLFALANTAIIIESDIVENLQSSASLGIIFGLLIGKPVGIFTFVWLAIYTGLSRIPHGVNFKQLLAVGFLGGIGFTMSIFIALLAFSDPHYILDAKLAILFSSMLAGITGFILLKSTTNATT